jgi:hypothetical protein
MSPIRPENRARYPSNWKAISERIRFERAKGRCECIGECGDLDRHRWLDDEVRRCPAIHGKPAPLGGKRVILTVAHLDHVPENCADDNLRAMCQRCHLRYDAQLHQDNARLTRERKRAK